MAQHGIAHRRTEPAPCHSLIYASTALFPPRDVLLDIVRVAERENAAHGLSGMLCYSATRCIQLLEGPEPALDQLWRNLARDLRHRIFWTVRCAPAPRRIPALLPMGYASESQIREWDVPLFGCVSDKAPDPATSALLSARVAALAVRIYPRTFASDAAG